MIQRCLATKNGVVHLTIDERNVPAGESHQRSGLYVESHVLRSKDSLEPLNRQVFYRSGEGVLDGWTKQPVDGIYFGSNVSHSSRVYHHIVRNNALVDRDGALGSMRHLFTTPLDLKAGDIFWITDRTPQESLPLPGSGMVHRQFLDLWWDRLMCGFRNTTHRIPLEYC
ncbi:hypothetical protein M427DRAFT_313785 [Gonapodya prolifera JEL478]|uniref:Uncharacterized protein n=1 Tax=Gonapodya prolifera (strain JEL478) TaxID=1344416 RepID=A0A139AWY7_GONPJ|nr:hypothetical protein M427DRAFT_313785 [Gonapodya prolifera JEL478]|eukprot:KXS21217.1 hypothetical protein M427DRAFT_313785 [Gonapodya prolifera JEL478]